MDLRQLIETRIHRPEAIAKAAAARRGPASALGAGGTTMIIAADHPARGMLKAGARELAMADRWELLDARADSVRSERARRISETREKYQASHEVRPYRLHIYEVPVWRLPVDVRRGDRRYPLTLDWLIPLTRFADVACPRCGVDERLVATKTGLGCAGCVPRRTVQLAPEPTRLPAKPAAKAKQVVTQPPTPSSTRRRCAPIPAGRRPRLRNSATS